jgi:short-subunit dehydrogenase involved in D-alanine esterification of teichoic acids
MSTILITGGASGLGKTLVKDFLKDGNNVIFTYNSSEVNYDELSIKELEGKKVEGANSSEETASGETILWSSEAQDNKEENLEGDESAKD